MLSPWQRLVEMVAPGLYDTQSDEAIVARGTQLFEQYLISN